MSKDCKTCIYKEGSCYPSTTIFDKDKTCKSYDPDYEGYIADLERENAELKEKLNFCTQYYQGEKAKDRLTKAEELLQRFIKWARTENCEKFDVILADAEQFLKEIEK